ncbi:CBO0543 family protein [Bacillus sp. CGMCC 1.16607]|uniref:CBO0543 family protein n=1 Tax=Bacillus sp. CGMCC 1.16607 TaxID=3351842 RepID=UPI00363DEC21
MTNHYKEKTIIAFAYIIVTFLLIKFVPKNKIRHALVSFLFKQVITWFFGLLVVEKNLIKYPYRPFFKKANKASFCFEYYIYPALCVIFNIYYPERGNYFIKTLYFFCHTSVITGLEILALKYTKLIRYKNWTWYWSFITIGFTYYVSHAFYKWFFKDQLLNIDHQKADV